MKDDSSSDALDELVLVLGQLLEDVDDAGLSCAAALLFGMRGLDLWDHLGPEERGWVVLLLGRYEGFDDEIPWEHLKTFVAENMHYAADLLGSGSLRPVDAADSN